METISWAGRLQIPSLRLPVATPVYDKSSDNGKTLLQNWPNAAQGDQNPGVFTNDGYQPQLVNDPAGSGRRVYAMTTRDTAVYSAGGSSFQRSDLTDYVNFQHLGTNPDWLSSPFRTGQEWWFSWEIYHPLTDVLNDVSLNLGHYRPMAGQFNFNWQLHQDNVIQGGSPAYSQVPITLEVIADAAAANPKYALRFIGGNLDNATSNANLVGGGGAFTRYEAPSNSLVYDAWRRFVMRLYIANGNDGYAQAWLDGTPVVDMLAATPVGWTKLMLNASNNLITQSVEATQPTNMYRVTSPDSQGHTGTSGTQYPGVMNYHDFHITGSTENPNNVVTLHREWKAGRTRASVGG
jgi:hypothetical protein